MIRFRYAGDGLCLAGCCLYALNRWLVAPRLPPGFFHSYFNDLLLIPCALPPILLIHRKLALRTHDRCPSLREIGLHLGLWSLLFEWIGPHWITHATADPFDIVAYTIGAGIAALWWHRDRLPPLRPA